MCVPSPGLSRSWLRLALAVASGLLLAAAFEPVAFAWLIPAAVAGYVLAVRGLRARAALLVGLGFGIAFYFTHIVWMRTVGTDAWLALAGVEALFYAALGPVTAVLARLPWWPLWVAAAWATMEVARSGWPFSGMPWGRLAYGVADTPAAPALAYAGATGVSLGLALLGSLLAWLAVTPRRWRGVLALVGVLVAFGAAALRPWTPEVDRRLDLAVVQGNVPGRGDDILFDSEQVTRNLSRATVELAHRVDAGEVARPDLVVWPENSTARDPFTDGPVNALIESAVQAIGVPVLVGGIVDGGKTHIYNQGIVWDPVTGPGERYTKRHPVPFGEYIPFRGLVDGRNFGRLAVVGRDMVAGTRRDPLRIPSTRLGAVPVADAICFDIAYDDVLYDQVSRGAQLVTVQTSNATFIYTHQIEQQFAITRLRAIETGRYVAVSSPNGISGIVAPDGHVVARTAARTADLLRSEVGLITETTPAVRLGAVPARVLAGTTLLGLAIAAAAAWRRRSVERSGHDDPTPPREGGAPTRQDDAVRATGGA